MCPLGAPSRFSVRNHTSYEEVNLFCPFPAPSPSSVSATSARHRQRRWNRHETATNSVSAQTTPPAQRDAERCLLPPLSLPQTQPHPTAPCPSPNPHQQRHPPSKKQEKDDESRSSSGNMSWTPTCLCRFHHWNSPS
jgi:hypothetical protein